MKEIIITEDDDLEGVFYIEAENEEIFLERLAILELITGFTTGCLDSYDYQGDECYKIIMTSGHTDKKVMKQCIEDAKKYDWFNSYDTTISLNGQEVCDLGEWEEGF